MFHCQSVSSLGLSEQLEELRAIEGNAWSSYQTSCDDATQQASGSEISANSHPHDQVCSESVHHREIFGERKWKGRWERVGRDRGEVRGLRF